MNRIYENLFKDHLTRYRQMLFAMGPRQAGKTTTSLMIKNDWENSQYLNWDKLKDRKAILDGCDAIAEGLGLPQLSENPALVIFDEIHKYPDWKNFLKGFYDSYPNTVKLMVTGSARLNIFKKGGDSLMGRYFYYRYHPLTVAEIIDPDAIPQRELRDAPAPLDEGQFQALMHFGGFPDPFLRNEERFFNRWKSLRLQQLFEEDIRELTKIHQLGQMEILAELLRHHVGELVSYESLAKKTQVSSPTIRIWLDVLKSFYYCFEVRPYSKNIARSLIKEPKYYLWDWSFCENNGHRIENFVASHLLKAVHFWSDIGLGDYQLNFIRDKEQREVDFVVVRNGHPWMLIEVKTSATKGISPALYHFQEATAAPYAFQLALDLPYVDKSCFYATPHQPPVIVPMRTFLSQLI